jgi:hypothetical protein
MSGTRARHGHGAVSLLALLGVAAWLLHGASFAVVTKDSQGRARFQTQSNSEAPARTEPAAKGTKSPVRSEPAAKATKAPPQEYVDPNQDSDKERAAASLVGGAAATILTGGSLFGGFAAALVFYAIFLVRPGAASASGAPSTNAGFDPRNEVGAMLPFGYWDPAGLMKQSVEGVEGGWEWKDEATFKQYRAAELKHGRLAMVALTGMITASFTRFGYTSFQDSPDGLQAMTGEAAAGLGIIFLAAGLVEIDNGDGKFDDPLNIESGTGGAFGDAENLRNKELAHGRLAMSAVFTLWLYEYNLGQTPSFFLTQQLSAPLLIALFGLLLIWFSWDEEKPKMPADSRLLQA